MRRGEVWWAEMEGPAGNRPVVLLSRDEAYTIRSLVIIAPVTTRIRNISSEVLLSAADGMTRDCVINSDTITTIAKEDLKSRITMLSPGKLQELDAAVHYALGLNCNS
jgi:mRNA interferase MazF